MHEDPFIPKHKPEDFIDEVKPLMCPPYEPDPSQSCPHLHCAVCKFKLATCGLEDENGKTTYSCFSCDAVYVAQREVENKTNCKQIPEHHSPLQHIMSEVHGGNYRPIESLEEARKHPETSTVILEGDWGGIIYATCPVKHLQSDITHDKIVSLCKKLERDFWGYVTKRIPKQVPDEGGWGVHYQHLEPGSGVWGGMGGGKVVDGLWTHSKIADKYGRQIKECLIGEKDD